MKGILLFFLLGLTTLGTYWFQSEEIPFSFLEEYGKEGFAQVIRDKESKEAYLRIRVEGKWKLFAGPTLDLINMSDPLLKGKGSGTYKLKVPIDRRSYFLLLANDQMSIVAERHLPMKGGYNFRDLGGRITQDGRIIRWGRIFRSDDMHTITDDDIRYLSSIPFATVVDFRCEEEKKEMPNIFTTANYFSYTVNPEGFWTNNPDLSLIQPHHIDSLMCHINVLMVSDQDCINSYRAFFTLLHKREHTPFLFHCSSGKDRTGMAAALLLYGLGVSEEDILEDYLLSNTFVADKYTNYLEEYPTHSLMFEARPEFIQAGLRHIKENYGTVENYLKDVLYVDIPKLRQMYLY